MTATPAPASAAAARRVLAAAVTVTGTIVWTHALAGLLRGLVGIDPDRLAPAAAAMTLGAAATAIVAAAGGGTSRWRPAGLALLAGLAGWGAIAVTRPGAAVPALALPLAGATFAALGAWLARALPAALDRLPARHPRLAVAWVLMALVAVVQVGRLATHVTDRDSDWFVGTRHPFYAAHECANAYVYGAELQRRGETDLYDPAHYPGLTPDAEPHTEIAGLVPEDPFQYPPQFLLLPRLAIAATGDYGVIRSVWFGLNVTLCMGAVLGLAFWIGGRAGTVAGLLSPAVLASFPVLHDFQYGQFHFAAVALAVLGMIAFRRGRGPLGGTLLAGAILSKLFPAVLLVPLAFQRRWRDLAWTAAGSAALTALALVTLGATPFAAFVGEHVPRLADGSAFAFDEAWPGLAGLIVAGNQGIHGIVDKLAAMGVPGAGDALAGVSAPVYGALVLALGGLAGLRAGRAGRAERAAAWLGLVGLASLASAGAWGDYVPLTCVWLLALLAPFAAGRPATQVALSVTAAMQVFLIGTLPIGDMTDARWMIPVSLAGALAMLGAFTWGALGPAAAPSPARARAAAGALAEPGGAARRS